MAVLHEPGTVMRWRQFADPPALRIVSPATLYRSDARDPRFRSTVLECEISRGDRALADEHVAPLSERATARTGFARMGKPRGRSTARLTVDERTALMARDLEHVIAVEESSGRGQRRLSSRALNLCVTRSALGYPSRRLSPQLISGGMGRQAAMSKPAPSRRGFDEAQTDAARRLVPTAPFLDPNAIAILWWSCQYRRQRGQRGITAPDRKGHAGF